MAIPDFNFEEDERADNVLIQEPVIPAPLPGQKKTEFTPYKEQDTTPETTPTVAPVADIPEFKESEYLGGLLTPVPRPTEDKERKKRLETMAGAKGIGKALSVLGDAFALSREGLVPRRKIETAEPAVAQLMEESARFREKMEAADFQDYMNKLRTGQAIAGAKGRELKEAKAEKRFQEAKGLEAERYKEGVAASETEALENLRRYGIESKMTARKQTETERHNKAMEQFRRLTLFYSQYGGGKSIKGKYPLYNIEGSKIADVDDGQVDKMFDIIKGSVDIGEDLALLKSQLGEGITKEHKRTIVSAYSDIPEVAEFLRIETTPTETTIPEMGSEKKTFTFPGLGGALKNK